MTSRNLNATVPASAGYTAGLPIFMRNVFACMAFGLGLTAAASYVTLQMIPMVDGKPQVGYWFVALLLLQVVLVIPISRSATRNSNGGTMAFLGFVVFALFNGVTFAPVALHYTTGSLVQAFAISATVFGGAALWGAATKSDFTGWGGTLFMLLLGVIVISLLNIYFQSSVADTLLAVVTLILFVGITAYDIQKMQKQYLERDGAATSSGLVVISALSLYLNVMNIVMSVLRLFGVPVSSND